MNREEMEVKANEYYPAPEDNNPTIHQQHCYARQGFILGATLEKEETEKLPKEKGWVAVDGDGTVCLFSHKPKRMEGSKTWCDTVVMNLWNRDLFPSMTWEDEQIEVEIFIRKL